MNQFSDYYVRLFVEYIWQDLVFFFRDVLWKGIILRFFQNLGDYYQLLVQESVDFDVMSWLMVIITTLLNLSLIIFVIAKIVLWGRRYLAFRKIELEKNELIEEIAKLNDKVVELVEEKNQILAMKVSQLGINATTNRMAEPTYSQAQQAPSRAYGASPALATAGGAPMIGGPSGQPMLTSSQGMAAMDSRVPASSQQVAVDAGGPSRFVKLIQVDKEYSGKDTYVYMEESDYVALPEMVTRFVNFAASQLKLYYTPKMIMLFFSGMAASKVIILEGISGTGKTSLPYAMGKFFNNPSSIISVQPSWRDRAEILGYLNEFTKRFNETDFLKAVYEAGYRKDIDLIVLDEMNLARIEYYFAEFLSIMEMPDPSEWKIDLVPDSKPNDPLKLVNGKIPVPQNVWFIGTANKDDSTFTITDKVYDRAIALEFFAKGEFFQAPETEPIRMSYAYLQELFEEAYYKYPVSKELLEKFSILDKYVQANFKIAFGNRIMKQLSRFIPVYVACGGTEADGLDYIFAYKILRKFEALNLSFLRNELEELTVQISKIFGRNAFEESIKFIRALQKMI